MNHTYPSNPDNLAYLIADRGAGRRIDQHSVTLPSEEVSRELLERGLRHLRYDRTYLPYMQQPITREVIAQQIFNLVLI